MCNVNVSLSVRKKSYLDFDTMLFNNYIMEFIWLGSKKPVFTSSKMIILIILKKQI